MREDWTYRLGQLVGLVLSIIIAVVLIALGFAIGYRAVEYVLYG